MIIYVDIDGTICTEIPDAKITSGENIEIQKNYIDAEPYLSLIHI